MGFLFSKHKKPLATPVRIEPPRLPPPIRVFDDDDFLSRANRRNKPIEQGLQHIDFNTNKFNRHQRILF